MDSCDNSVHTDVHNIRIGYFPFNVNNIRIEWIMQTNQRQQLLRSFLSFFFISGDDDDDEQQQQQTKRVREGERGRERRQWKKQRGTHSAHTHTHTHSHFTRYT